MDTTVTLYDFKNEAIHINVVARFENGSLVIDGYDIGKRVEEYWGDSDYEYTITIKEEAIAFLGEALGVSPDQSTILNTIAARFQGNHCFSALGDFLDKHKIRYERFTWA
jgi:hypothetical protein